MVSLNFLVLFIGCSTFGRVHSQETQPRVCCLANSVISPCFRWCEENSCDNLLNPRNCSSTCEYNICVCDGDLYRNECNECVEKEQCYTPCQRYQPLVCPDPNEEVNGCFDPTNAKVCPNVRCSTPRDTFLKFISPGQSGLCALSICDCKDGYLRNKCGQCVPESQCFQKCCIRGSDPCSQPGEVRVTKYRKRSRSSRRSKRNCSPFSYKRNRRERKKSTCDCQTGLIRDKCGRCLPSDLLNKDNECVCTDPCTTQTKVHNTSWECLNECNLRYCFNYYEIEVFKNKTCPTECVYVCACSSTQNLWYNGIDCVPGDQCPPYDEAIAMKQYQSIVSLSNLATFTNEFIDYVLSSPEREPEHICKKKKKC